MHISKSEHRRVVIIGGGFAGIELAKALRNKPLQVLLIDRNNYFTFQPLLYQVATSGLEANSVAYPFRRLFRGASNVRFRMAEVDEIQPEWKTIHTNIGKITYDYLVIATGSRPVFFDLDPSELMPLKSIPNALHMRNNLLKCFEQAVEAVNNREKQSMLNIVIVGGGPTGVELAGALGEMKKHVIPKDYPELNASNMNIYLLEGLDRLLASMSKEASDHAGKYLSQLGVNVRLNAMVDAYDGRQVSFNDETILTENLIWTAGVKGALVQGLDDQSLRKSKRIAVDRYNRVAGYHKIYALGDVAEMKTDAFPEGHPMLAPVAMQQGRSLAENLIRIEQGMDPEPFTYNDRGSMATVGRNRAVVDLPQIKFHGFFAWFVWMFVHLMSLVGFRNKLVTVVNWMYSYFTYDRSLNIIIDKEEQPETKREEKVYG